RGLEDETTATQGSPDSSARLLAARAFRIALLALAVGPMARGADDPARPDGVVPSDPVFQALLTDGTTASGRIRQLDLDAEGRGHVVLVDKEETSIPLDRLVKLACTGGPPAYPPKGSLLVLPE